MIVVREMRKTYGRREVLHGVSLSIGPGVTGLLGPNGAGKTTLIRCMLDIVQPSGGETVFECCVEPHRSAIGYLPQKFGLLKELRVCEALEYIGILKGIPRNEIPRQIESCLARVNMLDSAQTRVSALSGGMTRRVGIAAALLGDPPVLIFDEPTAGLDPEERVRFKQLIGEMDPSATVLISTHIVEDLEATASQIIVLDRGRVVATGSPADIAAKARGCVFRVTRDRVNEHSGAYLLVRYEEVDGAACARVLARNAPPGFEPVEPRLEDGYLAVVQGLGAA